MSRARIWNAGRWRRSAASRSFPALSAPGEREALERLGGFPLDTLAEDQDLTIALQTAGYTVLYDSTAIAWTEAPDTIRGLAKQRFRWAFGTLQCLWKHREVTLRPRYGTLGLIARAADLAVPVPAHRDRAARGSRADLADQHSEPASCCSIRISTTPDTLRKMVVYYLAFLAPRSRQRHSRPRDGAARKMELGAMARAAALRLPAAHVLDRAEERFSPQLGPLVGWGKLERKSTVTELA